MTRPICSLFTLRTPDRSGHTQNSLPARWLSFGRTGFTPAGLTHVYSVMPIGSGSYQCTVEFCTTCCTKTQHTEGIYDAVLPYNLACGLTPFQLAEQTNRKLSAHMGLREQVEKELLESDEADAEAQEVARQRTRRIFEALGHVNPQDGHTAGLLEEFVSWRGLTAEERAALLDRADTLLSKDAMLDRAARMLGYLQVPTSALGVALAFASVAVGFVIAARYSLVESCLWIPAVVAISFIPGAVAFQLLTRAKVRAWVGSVLVPRARPHPRGGNSSTHFSTSDSGNYLADDKGGNAESGGEDGGENVAASRHGPVRVWAGILPCSPRCGRQ